MEWLEIVEKIAGLDFLKDLTLVTIVIFALRRHILKIESSVEGIRSEMQALRGIFRESNKRIANIEGTQEAHKYEIYEIKQELKLIKSKE